MSDDPRALEPCRLWLAVGTALATANKKRTPPVFSGLPVAIAATKPVARVVQHLTCGRGQLAFTLAVQTDKPGHYDVTYREQTLRPVRGASVSWETADGVHSSASVMGKEAKFWCYLDTTRAPINRMLVESPFMKHAHEFGTESKLSRLDYGWHANGGMTSTIEGDWHGTEEDPGERRERLGFVPYDDKKARSLTPHEWDRLPDSLPSGIVYRNLDRDGRMELRGAVTLEVRYGVAARPTVRTKVIE